VITAARYRNLFIREMQRNPHALLQQREKRGVSLGILADFPNDQPPKLMRFDKLPFRST
jgi:hypothetical protein